MQPSSLTFGLVGLVLTTAAALSVSSPPATAAEDDWMAQVLVFFGVAAAPSLQRGSLDNFSGDIFIAKLQSDGTAVAKAKHRVTRQGTWRWPVFAADSRAIFAIDWAQNAVVRLSPKSGRSLQTWTSNDAERIVKLIGARVAETPSVLGLIEDDTGARAAELILGDDGIEARDIQIPKDSKLLTHLYQSKRSYGARELRTVLEAGNDGRDVSNVEYRQSSQAPMVNVTNCSDRDCGQGSLSPNGRYVVYVKRAP
jgi:hypothetical protein